MIVLLATTNRNKLRELQNLFAGSTIDLKHPSDVGTALPRVTETGGTLKENALLKAKALAKASNQLALGDDSGLEVEVLGGAPGIRSARFARDGATDGENTAKLLKVLRSARKRRAKFRCVLALAKPTGETLLAEGFMEGEIAMETMGEGGFGYDPVFWLPAFQRTMAQISFDEKQRISHRAKAVAKLKTLLPGFL